MCDYLYLKHAPESGLLCSRDRYDPTNFGASKNHLQTPNSEMEQSLNVERIKTSIGKSDRPSSAHRSPGASQMISTNAILHGEKCVSHREERVFTQQTTQPLRASISDFATDDMPLNGAALGFLFGYSNYRRFGVYLRVKKPLELHCDEIHAVDVTWAEVEGSFQEPCVYLPGGSWSFLNYSTSGHYAFWGTYKSRARNYQTCLPAWRK